MSLRASAITVRLSGREAVRGCDLHVRRGEAAVLIGPNGAGKSTLLRALCGLEREASGEVWVEDRPLSGADLRERARRLAYLPQNGRIEWGLTVREVVSLGRHPHHSGFGPLTARCKEAVDRALEETDLLPLAGRRASALSGGETARVLLARALAVEAPALLVDEPVAALDPHHQLLMMEILRARARQGGAVLMVLHDLALATRFADRIVVMHEGRILADGTPEEALSAPVLETAYAIRALSGVHEGEAWRLPWSRTSRA
jgi:iron complex transport system ATP-binding protein